MEDLARITQDGAFLVDTVLRGEAQEYTHHWDAVQIIPKFRGMRAHGNKLRSQFALADIKDVLIQGNTIVERSGEAAASLQGITCFDGLLRNVTIKDNVISVGSSHEITLHGFMSGNISGNVSSEFRAACVKLMPARIGGSVTGLILDRPDLRCSLYVLSWLAETYWPDGSAIKYERVRQESGVSDFRTCLCGAPHDRYLFNFDLPAWNAYMQEHLLEASELYSQDVNAFCGWLQQEAVAFGECISGDYVWKAHWNGTTPLIQEFLVP